MNFRTLIRMAASAVTPPAVRRWWDGEDEPTLSVKTEPDLISTGFPTFDAALGGGLRKGRFCVILHDKDYRPSALVHHLSHTNDGGTEVWRFNLPSDSDNLSMGAALARWYRTTFSKISPDKVAISSHEVMFRSDGSRTGSHAPVFYGDTVITAQTAGPDLVVYKIIKNRMFSKFPKILVRHRPFGPNRLIAKEIEVLDAGDS